MTYLACSKCIWQTASRTHTACCMLCCKVFDLYSHLHNLQKTQPLSSPSASTQQSRSSFELKVSCYFGPIHLNSTQVKSNQWHAAEEDRRGIRTSKAAASLCPGIWIGQGQGPSLCQQPNPRGVQAPHPRGVQDPQQGSKVPWPKHPSPPGWHPCRGCVRGYADRWQNSKVAAGRGAG